MDWVLRTVTPADDEPTPLLVKAGDAEELDDDGRLRVNSLKPVFHHQEESSLQVAWMLTKLAVPLFMSGFSLAALRTTDSAVLGHTSTYALAVFSVADIWMKSSAVFLSGRVLSTLCSQAIGAGNKQLAGVWLQVSYVVLGSLSLLVMLLWWFTQPVLEAAGVAHGQHAADAAYFARVLMISVPVRVAYGQLAEFFNGQAKVCPCTMVTLVTMILNLVAGLVLVLGVGVRDWDGLGFRACPWVTMAVEYIQLLLLWGVACQWLRLHAEYWPGWSLKHLTRPRLAEYCSLYFPAMLSLASDFWRLAFIGAVAATIGDTELAVFNTSYRVLWLTLSLVSCIAGAVSIKFGMALGSSDIPRARHLLAVGTTMGATMLAIVASVTLQVPDKLGALFSDDVQVTALFVEIRWPLLCTIVTMNLAVCQERMLITLGMTRPVLYLGFVASWLGQVPMVLLLTRYWRADLMGLYSGVAAGYTMLVAMYSIVLSRVDLHRAAELAGERSEVVTVELQADKSSQLAGNCALGKVLASAVLDAPQAAREAASVVPDVEI